MMSGPFRLVLGGSGCLWIVLQVARMENFLGMSLFSLAPPCQSYVCKEGTHQKVAVLGKHKITSACQCSIAELSVRVGLRCATWGRVTESLAEAVGHKLLLNHSEPTASKQPTIANLEL